jgi:hypothetical protein
MSTLPDRAVRRAEIADAETVGRFLHDFNSEFDSAPARTTSRLAPCMSASASAIAKAGPMVRSTTSTSAISEPDASRLPDEKQGLIGRLSIDVLTKDKYV